MVMVIIRSISIGIILHLVFLQKREIYATWAWILLLFFLPVAGIFLYFITGQEVRKGEKEAEKEAVGETTSDNHVELFVHGEEKIKALLKDLNDAKKEILIQYYIIQKDEILKLLEECLLKKAAEGVKIKILYDSLGSRQMKQKDWKKMESRGIEIKRYRERKRVPFFFSLNHRNHRKIVVIDEYISYMGGFNLGKEYLGLDPRFGQWRDTHLRITGSGAMALRQVFFRDWGEEIIGKKEYYGKSGRGITVQIVTSGPFSKAPHIRNTYLRLIDQAKEKIWIQTPYFIPDSSIMTALRIALLSQKEVKIMIPCKPDHLFVYRATLSYVRELEELGAEIYIYDKGFLHAKGMIMDEMIYCYGSANMDVRSFYLNYEINAIIYEKQKVEEMCYIYREDLRRCRLLKELEVTSKRPKIRIKEQLCRLLSPLL